MKNSTSSCNTYLRCPQLWDYTYNHKLEPHDNSSFEANYGRAFHALREGDEETLTSLFGAKWQAVIATHYESYQKRWSAEHAEGFDVKNLAHEVSFEFTLAPGYDFHGIIDGVVEWQGDNWLLETKTTGSDMEKFMLYKEDVLQPGIYLLAAKHSLNLQPYNIRGIIWDVTRRPGIRQKKRPPEADLDYVKRVAQWYPDNRHTAFARIPVERSDDYLDDLASDIMTISDMQEAKFFPKNRNSCFAFNKQCGFKATCFGGEPLSNSNLYRPRKRR